MIQLIADSGATKTTWSLIGGARTKTVSTAGISPYFFTAADITALLQKDLLPKLKDAPVEAIHFYGTGCATKENQQLVKAGLKGAFKGVKKISVESDLTAAARALCGHDKGIACILGTGSNSCVYNGKKKSFETTPHQGLYLAMKEAVHTSVKKPCSISFIKLLMKNCSIAFS